MRMQKVLGTCEAAVRDEECQVWKEVATESERYVLVALCQK